MRQEYQIDFHTKLSENALYKMVYRAYITELKQFVRTIEKEESQNEWNFKEKTTLCKGSVHLSA